MNLLDTFLDEAEEHLSAMEDALLMLEEQGINEEIINTIFRAMHTIKGSAGMVGLDHTSYFTHHVESFLDALRSGDIAYEPAMSAVLLDARDHIGRLIHCSEVSKELMAISEQLIRRVQQWSSNESNSHSDAVYATTSEQTSGYWRVDFTPHGGTFEDGFDILPIVRELRDLGDFVVTTTFELPSDEDFEPTQCFMSVTMLLEGSIEEALIKSAFMFVEDDWTVNCAFHSLEEECRLGDILVSMGAANSEDLEKTISTQPKMGEVLESTGIVSSHNLKNALEQQSFVSEKQASTAKKQSNVKVSADKLDKLLDLVGELVIVQSAVSQHAQLLEDTSLNNIGEELSRLTTEIRDTTFGIRMLPVGSTFGRYRRLIRDLCQSLDKKVQLITHGADTEVDKMVLESLNDPLIHLLRNSMDHGIETPSVRKSKGKHEIGTITLRASHRNGKVSIEIEDDGSGLDTEKIKSKAIANGLINEQDELSESDIHQLIFAPGFSTASSISDVSGRGVGMDVVKTSIEAMQGTINIQSQVNKGTVTEILLPLTLAIIDGLMVEVGSEVFIIPLSSIEECIEVKEKEQQYRDGALLVKSRGEIVSALSLRHYFSIQGEPPMYPQCVIVQDSGNRYGIVVDSVIGQHQTVLKSLGKLYHNIKGLMGSTILGNGDVAMVIDTIQLAEDITLSSHLLSSMEPSNVDED